MLHAENARVQSRSVDTIEGRPNTGTFLVKPLLSGDNIAMLEIRVRAGAASPVHAHAHESLIYVVSGRLRTTIADQTFLLGPATPAAIRAAAHRVEALEDSVFVEVKSPPVEPERIFGTAP